jgi:mono/diheme cytochrome c family protein
VLGLAIWLAPPDEPSAPASAGSVTAGKQVFLTAGCAGCHTLADARSSGNVGPDLDAARPSRALVANRVTNGQGVMPSFANKLSETQIANVAAYVSAVAGD